MRKKEKKENVPLGKVLASLFPHDLSQNLSQSPECDSGRSCPHAISCYWGLYKAKTSLVTQFRFLGGSQEKCISLEENFCFGEIGLSYTESADAVLNFALIPMGSGACVE